MRAANATDDTPSEVDPLAGSERTFVPILARSRTVFKPVGPVAYDCVKVIVVRDGPAVLFSEFGQKPVRPGDVILLGANVLCGSEPEGQITVTTVYLDTDYILDQVQWQFAGLIEDGLEAHEFAETIYAEPAQILRVGEGRAGMLAPWLDELVLLSLDGRFARNYFRMHHTHPSVASSTCSTVRQGPRWRISSVL